MTDDDLTVPATYGPGDERPSDDATIEVSPEKLAAIRRKAAEHRQGVDNGSEGRAATTNTAGVVTESAGASKIASTPAPDTGEHDGEGDPGLRAGASAGVSPHIPFTDLEQLPVWSPPPRLKSESHQVESRIEPEVVAPRSGLPMWATIAAVIVAVAATVLVLWLLGRDSDGDEIEQALVAAPLRSAQLRKHVRSTCRRAEAR